MTYCLESPFRLCYLPQTDSTSLYLRRMCDAGEVPEYTVVVTDRQTAGRGQRGNTWEAEPGMNLTFSLLLAPGFVEANRQFVLSEVVSLAIKDALDAYVDGISIKWPNDIYWHDRKIAGILIEHGLQGACLSWTIVGIGLNVNQQVFTSPAPNPVSLRQILGADTNPGTLLTDILRRIHQAYEVLRGGADDAPYARRYFDSLFRKHAWATFADHDGPFEGRIVRVEPSGLLVVQRRDGGERAYAFKEIQYVL